MNLIKTNNDFNMVVDKNRVLEDTMRIKTKGDLLTEIGSQIPVSEGHGNFIGLAKFSSEGSSMLFDKMSGMLETHNQDYYTMAINNLAAENIDINFLNVENYKWCEIDTESDYLLSQSLFD